MTTEVQLACDDLAPTLDFFVGRLGFRVETIFPAEEPTVASLSGHGLRIRLAPGPGGAGVIRLACEDLPPPAGRVVTAPTGRGWSGSSPIRRSRFRRSSRNSSSAARARGRRQARGAPG